MTKMNGAQALIRQLSREGIETLFALPGVQIMAAFDALHEARGQIRLIQTRHEQATTYMAHGYAQSSGRVGVALVVPGPGALNASAGLGTAYASSSPVLLISGQIPSQLLGKGQGHLHELDDQLEVFKPITKWNHRVTRMEAIPEAVHEAMRRLRTGRPRPVELEIPPDILSCSGETELIDREEYPRPGAPDRKIERAAQLLAAAKKTAIIAGGGTLISEASRELLEVAEFLQSPLMTTPQAKGVVPENHPLAMGADFASLGPAHQLLPDCDAILAVGTRLLIRDLKMETSKKVVRIDIDGRQLASGPPAAVAIEADAREALSQLLRQLRQIASPAPSRAEEIANHRRTLQKSLRNLAPEQLKIVDSLRNHLREDAILVSGVTNIGYWSHLAYSALQPRSYLTSSYFATLGFAFPAALGAKVCWPGRQVVALCGDGGFLYNLQELSTAVQYGLQVVALVFNNNSYGASRWDQTHNYDGRYIGTELHNPDFVQLAESFGAVGLRTLPDQFEESLQEALQVPGPVVLEVVVPNMLPPFQIVHPA